MNVVFATNNSFREYKKAKNMNANLNTYAYATTIALIIKSVIVRAWLVSMFKRTLFTKKHRDWVVT